MSEKYKIVSVEKPEESAWGIIGGGLSKYNIEKVGDNKFQRLCFTLQDSEEEIVGGILGEVYWGWLYVDLLWVKDELHGLGYGHRLLIKLEDEGRKLGAKNAYLDTFSFQVPNFYKDHDYQVFGELQDFPPGHQRYFFRKEL
ncbi:MAG: GNAT family N-acetyltransferase [Anaerolineae bacterium]|jgi:GNAT superfamily N-acetyltransferase|nr:GNAT family N-acetyltransferase [Anaerolineae bacterium]MBT3714096.1 GNAT family N-acetyltransferase [Anaerolineae bacterium]MBT4309228.1 GNAT family N-acetyltransferase [Anaerolineae bacterium]MBT4459316.1 GNAT family N-acetyltransferase [Anaerolineae bacterium]MBT4841188.1 GNAT family N-acetyltransferase [Anaerolineae bacterium]